MWSQLCRAGNRRRRTQKPECVLSNLHAVPLFVYVIESSGNQEGNSLAIYKCSIDMQVTDPSSPEHQGVGCWDPTAGPPASRCCSLHVFSGLGPGHPPPTIPGGKTIPSTKSFFCPKQSCVCQMTGSSDNCLDQNCDWDKGGGVSWLSVNVIFY